AHLTKRGSGPTGSAQPPARLPNPGDSTADSPAATAGETGRRGARKTTNPGAAKGTEAGEICPAKNVVRTPGGLELIHQQTVRRRGLQGYRQRSFRCLWR